MSFHKAINKHNKHVVQITTFGCTSISPSNYKASKSHSIVLPKYTLQDNTRFKIIGIEKAVVRMVTP